MWVFVVSWKETIDKLAEEGRIVTLADIQFQQCEAFKTQLCKGGVFEIRGRRRNQNGEYEWVSLASAMGKEFAEAFDEEMGAVLRRVRKKLADNRMQYVRHLREHAAEVLDHDGLQLEFPETREDDWKPIDLEEARKLIHYLGPDVVVWVGHESGAARTVPEKEDHAHRGQCYTRPQYQTAVKAMETIAADEAKKIDGPGKVPVDDALGII